VDAIKVDQGFVADIGQDPSGTAIVAAVCNLGHVLAQGFLHAVPASEVVALVRGGLPRRGTRGGARVGSAPVVTALAAGDLRRRDPPADGREQRAIRVTDPVTRFSVGSSPHRRRCCSGPLVTSPSVLFRRNR
jgi:hypothetical protein